MAKVAVIGIGNAGDQVADLGKVVYGLNGIALNSSKQDIDNVFNIPVFIMGDERGSGKDRVIAKKFVQSHIRDLLVFKAFKDMIEEHEVFFIVTSADGGTGSGMGPVVSEILSKMFPAKRFIVSGILPVLTESLGAQQNSIDYMQEVRGIRPTYMLYDNNRRSNKPTTQMMLEVNRNIVDDFAVITGLYMSTTPYSSIDEKDLHKIISTPDRLVILQVSGFNDKDIEERSIEDRIIDELRKNVHAEIDHDQIVKRMGVIINLNEKLYKTFDAKLPKLKEIVGEPVEGFEHTYINQIEDEVNRVIVILAGLSVPDDRLIKTVQRIEEAKAALARGKDSSVLDGIDNLDVRNLRANSDPGEPIETPDIDDILSRYLND